MKHRNNIAAIRTRFKASQVELADALGIKQTRLSTYETGKVPMPVAQALLLIRWAKGHKLLIDLNHVFAEADLPPDDRPEVRLKPAPAQAAQAGG